ncbi:unnamed protein product, partial [marine sediment metagenome]
AYHAPGALEIIIFVPFKIVQVPEVKSKKSHGKDGQNKAYR